jgi:hypothetical protein
VRVWALLAVSALLGQHAAQLAHALTTEHVRCAEHGDLVDASGSSPIRSAPNHVLPVPAERSADHEHCAVDQLARTEIATSDLALSQVPHAGAVDRVLEPALEAPSRSLLRIAPKTSPPSLFA